jgi:phosphoglycerate dehydrogenase-like enzyme
LGYGAIGRQTARLGKALGMDVIAFTRSDRSNPVSRRDESYFEPGLGDPEGVLPSRWFYGSTTDAVNEFLSQDIDLLVIATPLTPETQNLIAAPQFEILSKRKAFVSNIARGGIIKTDDLIDALNRGLIRGAALDVTDPEPLPQDHPLWKAKNVIITPHVSGGSTHYFDRLLRILETNLSRLVHGEPLVNGVDRQIGY